METQKLLMTEGVFDALTDGKRVTIRKGRRNIQLGDIIFESTEIKRIQKADIIYVMYSLLKNIPIDAIENDGFNSVEEMLDGMKGFYPDITLDSECTIVYFDIE